MKILPTFDCDALVFFGFYPPSSWYQRTVYPAEAERVNYLLRLSLHLCSAVLHIFSTSNGKVVGEGTGFKHHCEVIELALSQRGDSSERQLAYIDKNNDLYLAPIRSSAWKMIHIGEEWVGWGGAGCGCVRTCAP